MQVQRYVGDIRRAHAHRVLQQPLALSIIVGVIAGGLAGQPTVGFLAGLAVGIVIALAIWWPGRNR